MNQSNQPFKRPKLSENEEYLKVPPPPGQENKFIPPNQQQNNNQNSKPELLNRPIQPPSQEEINWAIQLEEKVNKQNYKPTKEEEQMYQDIANRIIAYQKAQAQAQKYYQAPQPQSNQNQVIVKKSNSFINFLKFLLFLIFIIIFWAKASILVLEPCNFVPKGRIYIVLKPKNFDKVFYSFNMDKIIDKKLKNKSSKFEWYYDPEYWEKNYILIIPYISF
ncbi:MAG: hypothetical protein KatS3mg068_2459 [Candidatus Sericytochromatia bacterium]|nr:MAG: hypothetical protein KatS3mg068_2459 [Candidatus Sericytochromatia bacterium]